MRCNPSDYSFGAKCYACPHEEECVSSNYHNMMIHDGFALMLEELEESHEHSEHTKEEHNIRISRIGNKTVKGVVVPEEIVACYWEQENETDTICFASTCQIDWIEEDTTWLACSEQKCKEGYEDRRCSKCVCNDTSCWQREPRGCFPCQQTQTAFTIARYVVLLASLLCLPLVLLIPSKHGVFLGIIAEAVVLSIFMFTGSGAEDFAGLSCLLVIVVVVRS